MKPRQWMQVAAVASAMGLAGAAWANDTNDATKAQPDGALQALPSGGSASSGSTAAATIDANTPPSRGDAASAQTGSAQTGNPAADLDTNADVNGGAGIDNPDNRGNPNAAAEQGESTEPGGASSSMEPGGASSSERGDVSSEQGDVSTQSSGTSSSTPAPTLNDEANTTSAGAPTNDDTAPSSERSSDVNGQVDRGATQGSTMTSPKPNSAVDANAPGARSSATQSGSQGRFADGNSSNFQSWMSDYASQHDGRISRDEFLAQMGRRWDEHDTQRAGLTPVEVEEIFVFTPADDSARSGSGSAIEPGADVQGRATQ